MAGSQHSQSKSIVSEELQASDFIQYEKAKGPPLAMEVGKPLARVA